VSPVELTGGRMWDGKEINSYDGEKARGPL